METSVDAFARFAPVASRQVISIGLNNLVVCGQLILNVDVVLVVSESCNYFLAVISQSDKMSVYERKVVCAGNKPRKLARTRAVVTCPLVRTVRG